jgi:UDP-2,4-diacetamido-2,4,6-trideoxy-beta-L-altropyranose hydrolase
VSRKLPLADASLVLRVDASPVLGTGHLMRSIALGQAWCDLGGRVVVATATEERPLLDRLAREDFEVYRVPSSWPDEPAAGDLSGLLETLPGAGVVVDGYHFAERYLAALHETGRPVVVVDDLAHLGYYDVDLVVNQNLHATTSLYRTGQRTRLLLGPSYALLRREFDRAEPPRRRTAAVARRLLVTVGGADPRDVTRRILGALRLLGDPHLDVTVVVGAANPGIDRVRADAELLVGPCRVIVAAENMARIYERADLAISAAGTSTWELARLATPALLLETAPSERLLVQGLRRIGLFESLGDPAELTAAAMARRIAARRADRVWRRAMSVLGPRTVDGRGRDRVVAAVAGLAWGGEPMRQGLDPASVTLRRAATEDRALLWLWANDPDVREASFQRAPIPWRDHSTWFDQQLGDAAGRIYIGLVDGTPAGVARFRSRGRTAVISVSVGREWRKRGVGARLIAVATTRYLAETDVARVDALIRAENEPSVRAFARAGYIHARGVGGRRLPDGALRMVFPRAVEA